MQISLKEARMVTGNSSDFKKAMKRNRFDIPANSACCTIEWMQKARQGEIFCLKYGETVELPCPDPPLK